jgi:hypothetical protein
MQALQYQVAFNRDWDVCDSDLMRQVATVESTPLEVIDNCHYTVAFNKDAGWFWYENGSPVPFVDLPDGYEIKEVKQLEDPDAIDACGDSAYALFDDDNDVVVSDDVRDNLVSYAWIQGKGIDCFDSDEEAAEDCIEQEDIDASDHDSDVYEHYLVSDLFARRLKEQGQTVVEAWGLDIWCRCTTGQAIALDSVIQDIAAAMRILPGQEHHMTGDWYKYTTRPNDYELRLVADVRNAAIVEQCAGHKYVLTQDWQNPVFVQSGDNFEQLHLMSWSLANTQRATK